MSETKETVKYTNTYYMEQIPILIENGNKNLNLLKDLCKKCDRIETKESRISEVCEEKINKAMLISFNENDPNNFTNFETLNKLIKQEKIVEKNKLLYTTLMLQLENKVNNGEISQTLYNLYQTIERNIIIQNQQDSFEIQSNEQESSLSDDLDSSSSSSSFMFTPKLKKSQKKHIQFSSKLLAKPLFPSGPTSSRKKFNRNSIGDISYLKRQNELYGNLANIDLAPITIDSSRVDIVDRVSLMTNALSRLDGINKLSSKINALQIKLRRYDKICDNLRAEILKHNEGKLDELSKLSFDFDLFTFNLQQYSDVGVMCDPIPLMNDMKNQINKNTIETSGLFLTFKRREDCQNYLKQLEIELNITNVENNRKLTDFNTLIATMRTIDPSYYFVEGKKRSNDPRLNNLREKKEKKLEAINKRIDELKQQTGDYNFRCLDTKFLIENLMKKRMKMLQLPKLDVKKLCYSLQTDRGVIHEHNRQIKFHEICATFNETALLKTRYRYSKKALGRLVSDTDSLLAKVGLLKMKFDHVRAPRENHSYILTNDEELKFLQRKINDARTAIEVNNMRMSGIVCKVEKLIKLVNQQGIYLPDPPPSFVQYAEYLSNRKNQKSKHII